MAPTISVLLSTYNRKELFKRALNSVLAQTYSDIEIIIIDDQSTDNTQEEILKYHPDKRITYIYNEQNQAAELGDKVHIKRFVHELARGKYWIYLDSDDMWLTNTLLARQIALFEAYPEAAMVTGGQESHFNPDNQIVFTPGIFPHYLTSDEFLEHFANNPIACNIIGGARLYNRKKFIDSGALTTNDGRWESGFELTLAPVCYGSHIYLDEPCIRTDIRPENASFNETQLTHYLDSVASVRAGFRKAKQDFPRRNLEVIERRIIKNISQSYLGNAEVIKAGCTLSYCSAANTSRYVTQSDVDKVMASL